MWGPAVAAASLLGLASFTSSALAHDPPEVNRMLWSPEGDAMVLRVNRGLLFGRPGGEWRFMCGAAWGTPFGEQPDLVLLSDGRLLAATTRGLRESSDEGCTWSGVSPFGDRGVTALTQHPSDPNTLYLGVAGLDRGGMYESRDAGASWTQRLILGPDDHVAQIALAPTDPTRVYLNGLAHDAARRAYSYQITRSSDAGASWTRSHVPLLAGEDEALLAAISPVDPDTLLVLAIQKARGDLPDRVLVSRDAGETFATLLEAMYLQSASFSSDGRLAYAAGNEGFYRSNPELTSAAAIGEAQFVSYVTAHDDALYLCGNHSGFDPASAGVGVSTDDGRSFERMMAFTEVKQTVACAEAGDTSRACKQLWADWQVEVLVGVGGAPLDSVPDWMSLAGPEHEPEPVTGRPTLSSRPPAGASASRGTVVMTPSAAGDAGGGCSVGRSSPGSGPVGTIALLSLGGWLSLGRRRWRVRAPHPTRVSA